MKAIGDPMHKKTHKSFFSGQDEVVGPLGGTDNPSWAVARGLHQALGTYPPFTVGVMLRIHCMKLWWNLRDPVVEEELNGHTPYGHFAGLDGAAGLQTRRLFFNLARPRVHVTFWINAN